MSDTTSPSPRKYPKRWLAVLLSIPWPGLGFAYLGRGVASFVVFATLLACWWITLACAFTGHFTFTIFVATWAIYLVAWLTAIVAVFFAARRPRQSPRPAYSRWYGLIAVLVTWMLCWLVPRIFVPTPIEAFSIPAGSMVPALMPGDHLMSIHWDQLHRAPQRGEIVVFKASLFGGGDFVKRVVGLPGDTVQLRDNVVFVNGKSLPQKPLGDYAFTNSDQRSIKRQIFEETSPDGLTYRILYASAGTNPTANTPVFVVPAGKFFLLGDNRDDSFDSRFPQVGFVPIADFRARPLFFYYTRDLSRIGADVQ